MAKIFKEDDYCLGLQLKDRHICKKNSNHIGVVSAPDFMDRFVKKLKSGELKIETCPQVEVGTELNKDFIIQQLKSYQRLLDSEIIGKATKRNMDQLKN